MIMKRQHSYPILNFICVWNEKVLEMKKKMLYSSLHTFIFAKIIIESIYECEKLQNQIKSEIKSTWAI